jgi:tRNA 2-thiouridine synthesizing protein A
MDLQELGELDPAAVVDARGCACPGPLMEAKKGIGTVDVGEVVEIRSSDPGSRSDIPVWADMIGHEYLGVLTAEEGYDRIFVRRGK